MKKRIYYGDWGRVGWIVERNSAFVISCGVDDDQIMRVGKVLTSNWTRINGICSCAFVCISSFFYSWEF